MKLTIEEASVIAKKYIGKRLISCVKMDGEFIFQYESEEFDPFIAVNLKTGKVRDFTPVEKLGRYSWKVKHRRIF